MKLAALLLMSAAAALPIAADAQVRVIISGDYSADFNLPTAPTPDFVDPDFPLFALGSVPGYYGTAYGVADLTFFPAGVGGGILISRDGDYLLDAGGAGLFSGPVDAPRFDARTVTLTGLSTPGRFVVSIAPVPEPAAWVTMIAGFALLGGAVRYRRRAATVRFAA